MNHVVADTGVVSFLFKNHPTASATIRSSPGGRVALISFMTVAEVERWAIQYRWSEHHLCRKWAEVMVAAQAAGRRIECADAWIARFFLAFHAEHII